MKILQLSMWKSEKIWFLIWIYIWNDFYLFFFPGAFSPTHMSYADERDSNPDQPNLKEMSTKAVEILKRSQVVKQLDFVLTIKALNVLQFFWVTFP